MMNKIAQDLATITDIEIIPADLELESTFRTTLGEKKVTRNLWIVLHASNGLKGFGEASASLAMPEAIQETMSNVIQRASGYVAGKSLADWENLSALLIQKFPGHPTAISAVECAMLDAYCRSKSVPSTAFFGRKNVEVETDFTIPALDTKTCGKIVEKMAKQGFKKFKVKVTGEDTESDLDRLRLIPERAPDCSIIVDANQGWIKESTLSFLEKCQTENLPIVLVEQPLPRQDIEGHAFVKKRSPFPIAVDESLRTFADAQKIAELDAADVFNIKIAKSGLLESVRIAEFGKQMRKQLMIGCMMESKIGLAASVHWACGSGDFSFVDLDSFLLLKKSSAKWEEESFANRGAVLSTLPNITGNGISSIQ